MMESKKIGAILLYEFKMGHKAAETVYNINQAFSQDIIGECPVRCFFKNLVKEKKKP